jgi:hypothetical protein
MVRTFTHQAFVHILFRLAMRAVLLASRTIFHQFNTPGIVPPALFRGVIPLATFDAFQRDHGAISFFTCHNRLPIAYQG